MFATGLAACSFSGGSSQGRPTDAAPDSGGGGMDAGADADPICDPLTLNLLLDGAPLTDFATKLPFAVGDSITLNAGASCSPTGNINFTWTLGAGHFGTRGSDLDNFFIEVYPDDVGDLSLAITVDDGGGSPVTQAIPIVGVGFGALDIFNGNPAAVNEMVIADNRLWLATESGGFTQPIDALGMRPYENINDFSTNTTATVPADVRDVAYDTDNDVVTYLPGDGSAAYFWDKGTDDITTYIPVDAMETGTLVDAQHLAGGGVRLLTDLRAETSTDYAAFALEWNRDQAVTATVQNMELLAGGDRLFRFVDADNSDTREIFGNMDPDGIATFFEDAGGALWIGSSSEGIGVIDNFDDATVTPHLAGEDVRSIGQDAAGDMWVATGNGVFRFKADWGVWISLGAKHGLASTDDRALIVDEGGARDRILVGGADDLYLLSRP